MPAPPATEEPTPTDVPTEPGFPKPKAKFARHFTDPLYRDEAGEFAPFGTDEGNDALHIWADQRGELSSCTTLREMFREEDPDFQEALDQLPKVGPDVDGWIIGEGLTLLLLTGHIDSDGKRLVMDALLRSQKFYAADNPREFRVMARDLRSFPASDC